MVDTPRPGDQPLPRGGTGRNVFELTIEAIEQRGLQYAGGGKYLIKALEARERTGIERYGQSLYANDGRDHGRDLFEELLDAVVYCRARMDECVGSRSEATSREAKILGDLYDRLISDLYRLSLLRMAAEDRERPREGLIVS